MTARDNTELAPQDLDSLPPEVSFLLLHRPDVSPLIELLTGTEELVDSTRDIPETGSEQGSVVLLPFDSIRERGHLRLAEPEPIHLMPASTRSRLGMTDYVEAYPPRPLLKPSELRLSPDDDVYRGIVAAVQRDQIGHGVGANFVVMRQLKATLPTPVRRSILTFYANLLQLSAGAYWSYLYSSPTAMVLGVSPEPHVTRLGKTVSMTPISGTFELRAGAANGAGFAAFLQDAKERDELHMVLDEELKMLARLCSSPPRVLGPRLRQLAGLVHTEYEIQGTSVKPLRDILHGTLLAPTVIGGPLDIASLTVGQYEPERRRFYSGSIGLVEPNGDYDSAIIIRSAEVSTSGALRAGLGATIVRDSSPSSETAETAAKAKPLIAALTDPTRAPVHQTAEPDLPSLALSDRRTSLSPFWMENDQRAAGTIAGNSSRRARIVQAGDDFTWMLGSLLGGSGYSVEYVDAEEAPDLTSCDLVLLGPGPGSPLDTKDRRIVGLRRWTAAVMEHSFPAIAVCLSHQLICDSLGMDLVRLSRPNQGRALQIDYLGLSGVVGFYNSWAAVGAPRTASPYLASYHNDWAVGVCLNHVATMQFHPESILSKDGPTMLRAALRHVEQSIPALKILENVN